MKSSSKLPKCPKGWELMKVGDIRPAARDYKYGGGPWHSGNQFRKGYAIDRLEMKINGPYIRRKSVRPTTKQGGGK